MTKRVEIDQQFERLTVIAILDKRGGKQRVLCRCECGNEKETNIYALLSGHTKSCGCLGRERLALGREMDDLTDKTFGRLIARRPDGVENKSIAWICDCACGNVTRVTNRDLVSGNTRSCGCAMKDFVRSLKDHNEQHHTVDGVFVPLLRQKVQNNSKTGIKGVSIYRDKNGHERYMANITVRGKRIYLGLHGTQEKAAEARRKAEVRYHAPHIAQLEDMQRRRKECQSCGTIYYPERPRASKYCSDRCRYREQARQKREAREAAGKCPQCGGEWVDPEPLQRNKARHCLRCQTYYKSRREDQHDEGRY